MKIPIKKIDSAFFYIVLIDILFFPYIRFLGVSLSMLLVPIWFIISVKRISLDREDLLCFLAIFCSIVSFIIGIYIYNNGVILRNGDLAPPFSAFLPNTIIIIFSFLYFVFFKRIILKYNFSINKIIALYMLFLVLLNTIYFYDPTLFFKIRANWTLSNNVIEVGEVLSMYRFTSTFSDPNNFATIANATLAFILMNDNINKFYKLTSIPLVFYLLVGAMSNTGFVVFSIILVVFFIRTNFFELKTINSILKNFILSIIAILTFIITFIYVNETSIGSTAFERVESNSLDSRLEIWDRTIDVVKILSSIFYGDGGLAIIDGRVINPHTGHLHLIYNYGVIFYIIFLYVFFRKRQSNSYFNHLFMLSILIGFTVNVGVYELRFVGIMAVLTATLYTNRRLYINESRNCSSRL